MRSRSLATRRTRALTLMASISGAVLCALITTSVIAQPHVDASGLGGAGSGSFAGRPVLTLALLAALSLLPFLFMTATSFVKISVVFSILRNALGTGGQVPSGMVVTALSALLSLYVMAPVGSQIVDAIAPISARIDLAGDPLAGDSASAVIDAFEAGKEPLRAFLKRNASARELRLFLDLARRSRPAADRDRVTADDFIVVLPAFTISELTEAFQIGFLVFVPFLVVDMVVSNVLLALGMHMLSPTTVSMPFKLLLFVLVDGWYLLARALVMGYS